MNQLQLLFIVVISLVIMTYIAKYNEKINIGKEGKKKKDSMTQKEKYDLLYKEKLEEYIKSDSFSFKIKMLKYGNPEKKRLSFTFNGQEKEYNIERYCDMYHRYDISYYSILYEGKVEEIAPSYGPGGDVLRILEEKHKPIIIKIRKKQQLEKEIEKIKEKKVEDERYLQKINKLMDIKPLDKDLKNVFNKASEVEVETTEILMRVKYLNKIRKELKGSSLI